LATRTHIIIIINIRVLAWLGMCSSNVGLPPNPVLAASIPFVLMNSNQVTASNPVPQQLGTTNRRMTRNACVAAKPMSKIAASPLILWQLSLCAKSLLSSLHAPDVVSGCPASMHRLCDVL